MSSPEIKLMNEMLSTLESVMRDREELKEACDKLDELCISYRKNNEQYRLLVESLRVQLKLEKAKDRNSNLEGFTQNELKVIRMLVHPDRTGKDTANLFIKVNKLVGK